MTTRVLCAWAVLGALLVAPARAAVPASGCKADSRVMNSLFNHPEGAKRVCSGSKYAAYAREIQPYQALGVNFEIWTAPAGAAARRFEDTLKVKLPQFGYRASQRLSNGDVKYNHAQGRGVRVSHWTEGQQHYWMLFIY
ncbi:hypothetical protein [Deinococcus hohokamensis]|uniref:Uncharacterized protein n=1 Tax=Deinococcus hohokamensis TaxID=309883 RepID=A0ABV9I340_9DEIO